MLRHEANHRVDSELLSRMLYRAFDFVPPFVYLVYCILKEIRRQVASWIDLMGDIVHSDDAARQ